MAELIEVHQCVVVSSPIVIHVPINEDSHCGQTNIGTNNQVTEEHPGGDDGFITKLIKECSD